MVPDLIVLGNLIVDDIVLPDGTTRMAQPGGAVIYAALGASLWGTGVGLVSRVGDDYPHEMLDALRARGIDLSGVRPLGRTGVRSWILYERLDRRLVHHLGSPTHAEATPGIDDVPDEWWHAAAALVSPAPLPEQRRLISALARSGVARLAIDPHTPVTDETIDAWRTVFAEVQHFFVSESELQLSGVGPATPDLPARLGGGQLRTVALKRGEAGGVLLDLESRRTVTWSPRAAGVIDPTGAGDAFAGGFLSAVITGETIDLALARGVVSASFAIEAWGPAGLLGATLAEASRRLRDWFPAVAA